MSRYNVSLSITCTEKTVDQSVHPYSLIRVNIFRVVAMDETNILAFCISWGKAFDNCVSLCAELRQHQPIIHSV